MNSCTDKIEKSFVASKARRFANYVLDLIFFRILLFPTWFLIGYFAGVLGVLDADSAHWLTIPVIDWSLTIASLFFYYFAFETLWQRTPAKFITGTKVLNHNGTKPTARTIALRTLARLVPFEPLSFLGKEGCGWHDKWSGTAVVRAKTTQRSLADSLGEYGIEQPQVAQTSPEIGMGLRVQSQMATEERSQVIAEQTQTAIDTSEQKAKWLLLAFLVVCFGGVIAVRFSNIPATTRAGNQGAANEFGFKPAPAVAKPALQHGGLPTPSIQAGRHSPSLEETVRNEFKNVKSAQLIINQVRRRTLVGLQGVHVDVAEYDNNQNLLDIDQVRTDVELKLRYAGINVLSIEQCLTANGKPLLSVDALIIRVPCRSGDFFRLGKVLSLELYEQVYLERSPDVALFLATWEDSGICSGTSPGADVKTVEREVREKVKSLVEHFADDYLYTNSTPTDEPTRPSAQFSFTAQGTKHSSVALKGLTEIHVPQLYGSDISVQTTIIPQLEKAGITVLSSEQWNDVQDGRYPKKPYLSFKALVLGDDPDCFKIVAPLQLIDRVILARNSEIIRELPVWESKPHYMPNENTKRKEGLLWEIKQDVQDMVDEFINAYLSANSR